MKVHALLEAEDLCAFCGDKPADVLILQLIVGGAYTATFLPLCQSLDCRQRGKKWILVPPSEEPQKPVLLV